ncbi:MAG: FkbM family methyltransferase, partial [Roseimicrobium sp.]
AHHLYCQVIQRMPAIHRHPDLFTNAALKFAPGAQMRLNPTDVAHSRLAWLGVYEDALSDAIVSLARQVGGKLLDVGANYGYFSLLWCSARPENSAIAIEASPRNLAALRDNVNRNGLSDRITVCDWAASNITGSVSFELGPLEQTGWGGIAATSESSTSVTVPCFRLDERFSADDFTVVKIDCEGADPLVIEGASGLWQGTEVQHVFYEENTYRMAQLGLTPGSAKLQLERFGFRVSPLKDQDLTEFHAQRTA